MKILFILFILFTGTPEKKSNNIIVVDQTTKEELIGAKVIADSTTYYTDLYGNIILDSLKNKNVIVEYLSYETKTVNIDNELTIVELKSK